MDQEEKKEKDLFERYKLLVAARNFHYDNFNKWLTYFYVANAAIFVGYIQLMGKSKEEFMFDPDRSSLAILLLGWFAGLLLHWSSKGYYYWNINFIMLVNHYEKNIFKWNPKERIYSAMADKSIQNDFLNPISGANYSTSKIAILFSFIIAVAWGTLTLDSHVICHILPNSSVIWRLVVSLAFSVFVVIILGLATGVITDLNKSKKQRLEERKTKQQKKKIRKEKGQRKKYWFLASNTDPLHDLKIEQDG